MKTVLVAAATMIAACSATPGTTTTQTSDADFGLSQVCNSPLPRSGPKLTQPADDVPADVAKFIGVWNGQIGGQVCNTLVVEKIDKEGNASVLYSWGAYPLWGVNQPGWRVSSATLDKSGKLVLEKFPNGAQATYWFTEDTLEGQYRVSAGIVPKIKLTRADR